jgi:hypothetical protein
MKEMRADALTGGCLRGAVRAKTKRLRQRSKRRGKHYCEFCLTQQVSA